MKIYEHVQSVVACFAAHLFQVIQVGGVVLAGPSMFYCLPRGQKTQTIKTPVSNSAEMLICLTEQKWAANKRDPPMIGEIVLVLGAAVGPRYFAVAAEVQATQDDLTTVGVHKISAASV